MSPLFNILAVTGSAMFAGVLLAIGLLLGGHWKRLPAEAFLDSFNTFLPLVPQSIAVGGLALVGLVGSVSLNWAHPASQPLWLAATSCLVALFLLTAVWFTPTNQRFAARSLPVAQVTAKRDAWLQLHWVRIALATLASILGMLALSR